MSIRVQDFLKEFCHSGIGNDVKAARREFGSSTKVSRLADVSFNELKAAFSEVCAVPRVSVLVPVYCDHRLGISRGGRIRSSVTRW